MIFSSMKVTETALDNRAL